MASSTTGPSWNDPPAIKFEICGSGSKQHLLNKRIFLPLNKDGLQTSLEGDVHDDSSSKALSNKETVSSFVKSHANLGKNDEEMKLPDEYSTTASDAEMLSFVIDTFQNILYESSEKCEKSHCEISRRMNVMEESWNLNLSRQVRIMMYQMAQELSKDNVDAASKIHYTLMVQNVREVKNWMVGVKHLIEMKRKSASKISSTSN